MRHSPVARKRPTVESRTAPESRVDLFLHAHRGGIVAALCGYAVIRVLLFAAAFPLFNNVDEQLHFDSIVSFAQGRLPGPELPLIDSASAQLISRYHSFEYMVPLESLRRDHLDIPRTQLPPDFQNALYHSSFDYWSHVTNIEIQSPPLYYAVGALWYRLGAALGMRDWRLAYWVRFLNSIAFALLVWLSYGFVRLVYPTRVFVSLGVPALIAVFPQDVFFGMNRDVLSAPLVAAALLLMMQGLRTELGRHRYLPAGAFLVGLTFLVNVANVVLYAALAATLWLWLRQPHQTLRRKIWVTTASALAALVLPVLWMLRNYLVIGDLTGSKAKVQALTWTVQPFSDILDHPMFSWDGLSYFLLNNTRSFWRGEYVWHGERMSSAVADWFYVGSSFLLILVFVVHFVARRKTASTMQRLAGLQALWLVAGYVLFLAVISVLFDFHECFYPSRLHPFFVSGRIISGALLPFALMYVIGLEVAVGRLRNRVHPALVLVAVMLFTTVSEIVVRSPAFSSAFNFFALSLHPS